MSRLLICSCLVRSPAWQPARSGTGRRVGCLQDSVCERIAFSYFLLDFGLKVVVGVLGLPVTTIQIVLITKGSIGPNGTARQFWNEGPASPPTGFGQQILKGGPQRSLVRHALLLVGLESGVVVLDILRFWLSGQLSTSYKSCTERKATVRRPDCNHW